MVLKVPPLTNLVAAYGVAEGKNGGAWSLCMGCTLDMCAQPRKSSNNGRKVRMYEEMIRLLDENDIDAFTALYGKYAHNLTLEQVEIITERLKIKVAQQTLINQELKEELRNIDSVLKKFGVEK